MTLPSHILGWVPAWLGGVRALQEVLLSTPFLTPFVFSAVTGLTAGAARTLLRLASRGNWTSILDEYLVTTRKENRLSQRQLVYRLSSPTTSAVFDLLEVEAAYRHRSDALEHLRVEGLRPGKVSQPAVLGGNLMGLLSVLASRSAHLQVQSVTWRGDRARRAFPTLPEAAWWSDFFLVLRTQGEGGTTSDAAASLVIVPEGASVYEARRRIHALVPRLADFDALPATHDVLVHCEAEGDEAALRRELAMYDAAILPRLWTTNGALLPLQVNPAYRMDPRYPLLRLGQEIWWRGGDSGGERAIWTPLLPPSSVDEAVEPPTAWSDV